MENVLDDKRKISIRFSKNIRVQEVQDHKHPQPTTEPRRGSRRSSSNRSDRKIVINKHAEDIATAIIPEEEDVECQYYWNIEKFAEYFIDDIIECSVEEITRRNPDLIISPSLKDESFHVEWPKIEDCTIDLCKEKIDEYLSFWYVAERWKYNIEFLAVEEDECSEYFKYEAVFGIPNKQYPVCQVTASVFFTIEASKIKPKQCKVDVYYNFEGERLIHYPDKYGFQESWLFHIIQGKLNLIKTIRF